MRKTTKIALIIAGSLLVVGMILFSVVMSIQKWDFTTLSTGKYISNSYEISDDFNNLSIGTDTGNIIFALSDDGICKVECYEKERAKHSVSVKENTLYIQMVDERFWYDYIGMIDFGAPSITIYLPKTEYSSLLVKGSTGKVKLLESLHFKNVAVSLSTGHINVENISADTMNLSTSTGKITAANVDCSNNMAVNVSTGNTIMTNITCKNLSSSGSTGNISLHTVLTTEICSIRRSTGNVELNGCDAAEIYIETETGNVAGSLLSDKVFITDTSTGKINVPKTTTGGKCEIKTSTGNIKIKID